MVLTTECPNDHRRGPRHVIVGYGARPDRVRTRSWTYRACGVITWDEDGGRVDSGAL